MWSCAAERETNLSMSPKTNHRFAEGIRLFNQGNFFEAHEVWEEIWKKTDREEKIFYQGIIQAAAALVHVQRGNYKGALSIYFKSRPKLARFSGAWMEIDLEKFRSQLSQYFDQLRTVASAGRSQSSAAQTIVLGRPPRIGPAPKEH
jgi:predicted metal-dependent hydrolase